MNRRSLLLASLGLVLLAGCGRHPRSSAPDGERWRHARAGFSIVVPVGWDIRQSNVGVSLVRRQQQGGGYPTLNLRRLSDEEVDRMAFEGAAWASPIGAVEYRYQRWNNPQGRGYRLEALIRDGEKAWWCDASLWDPGLRLDRAFFEKQFWPILLSLQED